jgi:hypothetical protein
LFADEVPGLEAMGWHVELKEREVSLHGRLKNGKVRKGADVRLLYSPFEASLYQDQDGPGGAFVDPQIPKSRPYMVYSKRSTRARSFKDLSRAVVLFMEEAGALAPGD